jgi:hypothetical protein
MASFNVCNPKGIPMMVIIRSTLAITYSIAVIRPPQSSQIRLPIRDMPLLLSKIAFFEHFLQSICHLG